MPARLNEREEDLVDCDLMFAMTDAAVASGVKDTCSTSNFFLSEPEPAPSAAADAGSASRMLQVMAGPPDEPVLLVPARDSESEPDSATLDGVGGAEAAAFLLGVGAGDLLLDLPRRKLKGDDIWGRGEGGGGEGGWGKGGGGLGGGGGGGRGGGGGEEGGGVLLSSV